jgi:hypothetical protein
MRLNFCPQIAFVSEFLHSFPFNVVGLPVQCRRNSSGWQMPSNMSFSDQCRSKFYQNITGMAVTNENPMNWVATFTHRHISLQFRKNWSKPNKTLH